MKQRLLTLIATVLVAASTTALAAPSAPLSTPELKATVASNSKPTLVFS